MINEKKFKKLADKHLFALEKPRNPFGRTELEVFGKEELYKQLQLYFVSQQRELLEAYETANNVCDCEGCKSTQKEKIDKYLASNCG